MPFDLSFAVKSQRSADARSVQATLIGGLNGRMLINEFVQDSSYDSYFWARGIVRL